MRTVLPGKPQARLQAVDAVEWEGKRLVAYISGNTIVILGGPHELIQTIYHDGEEKYDALALDEAAGKIAVLSNKSVDIYRPYGREEGALKWSLEHSISSPKENGTIGALAWTSDAELLIARSELSLYQTDADHRLIWSRKVASSIKFAAFSGDGSLLATAGHHDRLVKSWRRQAFGADDTRFDFTYLPHPKAVNSIHWRTSRRHEHHADNALFTTCADDKIRIWAANDPHSVHELQFWAAIDMQECLQPRSLKIPGSNRRFPCFIDGAHFALATERALSQGSSSPGDELHALEHLTEVAKNNPEVCLVLDRQGNMSAWGADHIGHNNKKSTDVFNIAHVGDFKLPFLLDDASGKDNVVFRTFATPKSEYPLIILAHHFDGRVEWLECKADELIDPSPRYDRLITTAEWTGHDGPIKKLVRSRCGTALVSRTNDNEALVWKQVLDHGSAVLNRSSVLHSQDHIHRSLVLESGALVANLHDSRISLWDTRSFIAVEEASCDFHLLGKLLCLVQLPTPPDDPDSIYLATVTSKMEVMAWIVRRSTNSPEMSEGKRKGTGSSLREFCKSSLGANDELEFVLPVDPAGSSTLCHQSLDELAREDIISYTSRGTILTWTGAVDLHERTVTWLRTLIIETDILHPSLASGTSIRKAALVYPSRSRLTIWDQVGGQLEYDESFDSHDTVQDLNWSATPDDQSILAVGFPHKVLILAQLRYDYLHATPAWATVREIQTRELTMHPIGDSVWLGNGDLVIAAGNQLYVYDNNLNTGDRMITDLRIPIHSLQKLNLFHLVKYLNGALPVYHPQFLGQCILSGKLDLVNRIILALNKATKFSTDAENLDSLLSIPTDEFYMETMRQLAAGNKGRSSFADFVDDDEPYIVTEEVVATLTDNLTKIALPNLSSRDQIHLAGIIECVAIAEKYRRSMDDLAMRYVLVFNQHMLRKGQDPSIRVNVGWREIVWAFHSGSQDILVDLISKQFQGRMLWQHARESGMFMWMTDPAALRAQFEMIARNEYTKNDEKNPIHCSLYYLALRKKNVLLGLWRMAGWNREQTGTQRLLSNNFNEARWKTAALKNAYALLSKRRFEYAAAFFLLAGNLQDAINVCTHQLGDLQLAIAITRVYEGDESPVFRALLEDNILPQAALEGNRWLATWAFWMLGRRDNAIRALVSQPSTLISSTLNLQQVEISQTPSRSYLAADPSLIVLYAQLRGKTLQTLRGATKISIREEWNFVSQTARVYRRMGCDLLALDLVRNWEFLSQQDVISTSLRPPFPSHSYHNSLDATKNQHSRSNSRQTSTREVDAEEDGKVLNPRTLLRRRSSLVVDDITPLSPRASKTTTSPTSASSKPSTQNPNQNTKPKASPTTFEEPDANSLLDSFGF